MELGCLNSSQVSQLNPLFHTFPYRSTQQGGSPEKYWLVVSNSILSLNGNVNQFKENITNIFSVEQVINKVKYSKGTSLATHGSKATTLALLCSLFSTSGA